MKIFLGLMLFVRIAFGLTNPQVLVSTMQRIDYQTNGYNTSDNYSNKIELGFDYNYKYKLAFSFSKFKKGDSNGNIGITTESEEIIAILRLFPSFEYKDAYVNLGVGIVRDYISYDLNKINSNYKSDNEILYLVGLGKVWPYNHWFMGTELNVQYSDSYTNQMSYLFNLLYLGYKF